jgi:methylenetetrahydrofolate reductase (NADPH)
MDEISRPTSATLFEDRLRSGAFVITAEIVPPVAAEPKHLLQKVLPLRGLADAINLTDGAGARTHLSALAAASILIGAGLEPIMQLTCRDRNRIALQSDLLGAAALGIRNLLLLSGDDPSAGDQPDTKAVFDLDSRALTETARMIRDRGELPSGQKVAGQARFFLGAGDGPVDPPAAWQPDALKKKIAAGTQFVQSQFCMDAGVVRRYVERLKETGVEIFLLIGIAPLRSAGSARWMRKNLPGTIIADALVARMENAADPVAEGRRICAELIEELSTIPGVAGVHLMAPNNASAIPEVIAEVRPKICRAAFG